MKRYNICKDEHRFGNIYGHRRYTKKIKTQTKVRKFKKYKKKKSFMKMKNDKKSNYEMNEKFKKQYLLSLQFWWISIDKKKKMPIIMITAFCISMYFTEC